MLVATALVAVAAEVSIRRGDAFRLSPFVTPTTATAGATSVVSLLLTLGTPVALTVLGTYCLTASIMLGYTPPQTWSPP